MVQNLSAGRPLAFAPEDAITRSMEAFWRTGFEGTSLADLEAATELSRSSLYNTFGSKRDLFVACLREYASIMGDRLLAPVETADHGYGAIDGLLRRLEEHLTGEGRPGGCLIVNTLVEAAGGDPDIEGPVDEYLSRLETALGGALERAGVDRTSAKRRATVLTGMIVAVSVTGRSDTAARLLAAARAQVGEWASA